MIHIAGMMDHEGVQLCTRCAYVLTDYRGAMVPNDTPSYVLCGWAVGAHIEVTTGNPSYSAVTDEQPDCETLQ